jgi:serine/threonine-protein kinase
MTEGQGQGSSGKLGRYKVVYELGQGAMGTVFRGHDPSIDRQVALKTINVGVMGAAQEAEFRERFFREARAAGKLSHAGIVTIYDVGVDEDTKTPFLVMEFVSGITLEDIVHRDIKPANIIIAGEGQAKITDFGIAKLQKQKFTQTGQIMGTPAYMSPEQLTAAPVDGRSDLFSLGALLYWLLSGKEPFSGDTLATLTYQIVHTDPRPLAELNPSLGGDFDYVIQRALAKEPAKRYQTGRELADDIEDLKHGRPPRSQAGAAVAAGTGALPTQTSAPTAAATTAVAETVVLPRKEKRRWPWVALVAVLLLASVGGWWLGTSSGGEPPPPATATPAATTPLPAPAKTPPPTTPAPTQSTVTERPATTDTQTRQPAPTPPAPVAGWAAVQVRGTHNLDRATLYVFADGKQIDQYGLSGSSIAGSLRLSTNTQVISVRVRSSSISGRVPPGQRKKRRNLSFDQTQSIRARLKAGATHTLVVDANRNRGVSLRWAD